MKSERSLFFPLELQGVGTPDVESLRSYAERLALAHRLNPTTLIGILLKRMPLEGHPGARIGYRVTQHWEVHGGSDIGLQLAERLSSATTCDLACSTLAGLGTVLSPLDFTLGRRKSRYCPLCVAVPSCGQLPHGRLLWTVSSVLACPKHRVRLLDAAVCGAPESSRLPRSSKPSLQGVCNLCGSVGFKCLPVVEPEAASDVEIWMSEQVGSLVARLPKQAGAVTSATVREGIQQVLDARFEGQSVKPALAAGLARATVWGWVNGKNAPTLGGLLKFCARAQCGLAPLLEGRYEPSSEAESLCLDLSPRTYRRNPLDASAVRRRLREAASIECPPSAAQLADELKMDAKLFRTGFPQEYDQLQEARRTFLEAASKLRYENYEGRFSEAARALTERGQRINYRTLLNEAGMYPYHANGNPGAALEAVLKRFGKQRPASDAQ